MELFDEEPKQFLVVSRDNLKDVILEFLAESNIKPTPKIWISTEEAMELLQLKSKTSMQKLRDSGAVEFTQPMKKVILYRYESILAYLEFHSRKTF